MHNLPFGYDRPEDSPGFLLWQTTMLWQKQIKKALEAHAITHIQFVIMATLMWFHEHQYTTTQVLIAQQTKLDKMTVSKSLKKLVSDGYVHRIEHLKDTRAKSVTLTEKGNALMRIVVPLVERADAHFFSVSSPEEEKQFIRLLLLFIRSTDAT